MPNYYNSTTKELSKHKFFKYYIRIGKMISLRKKSVHRKIVIVNYLLYGEEHTMTTTECELDIKANGDYPLIKICDVRNDQVGINNLWHLFNVDEANEELYTLTFDDNTGTTSIASIKHTNPTVTQTSHILVTT